MLVSRLHICFRLRGRVCLRAGLRIRFHCVCYIYVYVLRVRGMFAYYVLRLRLRSTTLYAWTRYILRIQLGNLAP